VRNGSGRVPELGCFSVLAERAGNHDQRRDEQSCQCQRQGMAAVRATTTDCDRRDVRERQDEKLHARGDGERAYRRHREAEAARGRRNRMREDGHREQEDRVRERLRHEIAVVDHRRRRDGSGGGEQRERLTDDAAREPVRGEDGRRHHRGVDELRRRVGIGHRAEQPCGRLDQRRERRREEEVFAANGEAFSRRQCLGELRVEQLVVEDGRRRMPARLQEVVDRGCDEDERKGKSQRQRARQGHGLGRSLGRGRRDRAHPGCIGLARCRR
jgi:hypothetical protein